MKPLPALFFLLTVVAVRETPLNERVVIDPVTHGGHSADPLTKLLISNGLAVAILVASVFVIRRSTPARRALLTLVMVANGALLAINAYAVYG
jgi:hypothetical protein